MLTRQPIALLFSTFPAISLAATLQVAGFNIEGNDANATVIAKQMAKHKGIDLWGLSESRNDFVDTLLKELNVEGKIFVSLLGTTGRSQKLQIFFNKKRFTLYDSFELNDININNRVRAPLVALLHEKESGETFFFMVNHLYRSNQAARLKQSKMLNDWAISQPYPTIAVGDYNYDLSPENPMKHDTGFDLLTANETFTWIQPENLLPTQCNMRYKSVLDFVFVSRAAKQWAKTSTILNPEPEYCPDNEFTSDHRPIRATLQLTG